jgi:hypothetical protein
MMDRVTFNEFEAHIDREAKNWPTYPMVVSPGFPPMEVPMIPATIAEGIAEKWLVEDE